MDAAPTAFLKMVHPFPLAMAWGHVSFAFFVAIELLRLQMDVPQRWRWTLQTVSFCSLSAGFLGAHISVVLATVQEPQSAGFEGAGLIVCLMLSSLVALCWMVVLQVHVRNWLNRLLMVTTLVGGLGYLHWFGLQWMPYSGGLQFNPLMVGLSLSVSTLFCDIGMLMFQKQRWASRRKFRDGFVTLAFCLSTAALFVGAVFMARPTLVYEYRPFNAQISAQRMEWWLCISLALLFTVVLVVTLVNKYRADWRKSLNLNLQDEYERVRSVLQSRDQKLQSQIRRSRARYLDALESLDDGLFDYDIATDLLHVNPGWRNRMGYVHVPVDEQWPQEWRSYLHPDDLLLVEQALKAHLSGLQEAFAAEYRLRKADGQWMWVQAEGRVQKDPYGYPMAIIGVLRDIQQKYEATQALESAFRMERQLSVLKTEFVTSLSHELRTPLTIMSSSRLILSTMLQAGALTKASLQNYLAQMDDAIARLRHLVDDTISFAQTEVDANELNIAHFDLGLLVESLYNQYRCYAHTRPNLTLHMPEGPCMIRSDRLCLQQVLRHLLAGSIRQSGASGKVSVSLDAVADRYVFRIHDSHLVEDTHTEQLYLSGFEDALVVLDGRRSKVVFAIVQRLLDRVGGRLEITQKGLQGSCLRVELPKEIAA